MYLDVPNQKTADARESYTEPLVEPLIEDADGDWPVEHDGLEFYPVPESWITHARSFDRGQGRRRLYVVSAAQKGGWLYLRYTDPVTAFVQHQKTTLTRHKRGVIPRALTNQSRARWPRSITPTRDPEDHREPCETEHLVALWADKTDDVRSDEELRLMLADGGLPIFEEEEELR